eukprot:7995049-Pyramimonas_sp.AAC.1
MHLETPPQLWTGGVRINLVVSSCASKTAKFQGPSSLASQTAAAAPLTAWTLRDPSTTRRRAMRRRKRIHSCGRGW